MTKAQVKDATSALHQWRTLVGIPVLAFMIGDMYMDFKETRNQSIRHSEQIGDIRRTVDRHDKQLEIVTTYLFRRKEDEIQ